MLEVHVLASGSEGNCAVVRFEGRAVMVDDGLSHRRTRHLMDLNGIDPGEVEAILVTHEHGDHVSGVGPTARKLSVPVMCNAATFASMSVGPVEHREVRRQTAFEVAGMEVTPLPTSHNAADPSAYLFRAGGRSAVIATDTGRLTYSVEAALAEADVAVIESNYDKRMLDEGPYPPSLKRVIDSDMGHLSNVACARALLGTMGRRRTVFLAHLSKNNNTADLAKDTVAGITGIRRSQLDCLDRDVPDDTRVLKA